MTRSIIEMLCLVCNKAFVVLGEVHWAGRQACPRCHAEQVSVGEIKPLLVQPFVIEGNPIEKLPRNF